MLRYPSLLLLACVALPASANKLICHIHLDAEHPAAEGKARIIWNVGDQAVCAARNAQAFSGEGRCHCTFSGGERGLLPESAPPTPPDSLL